MWFRMFLLVHTGRTELAVTWSSAQPVP